jgi:hypothetical protein
VLVLPVLVMNLVTDSSVNSHRLGNRCLFVRIVSTISRCESGGSLLISRLLVSKRLAASVIRAEIFMTIVQDAKMDYRVKMEKRERISTFG